MEKNNNFNERKEQSNFKGPQTIKISRTLLNNLKMNSGIQNFKKNLVLNLMIILIFMMSKNYPIKEL